MAVGFDPFFEPGPDGIQREEKCMYWMRVPDVCGKNAAGEVFIIQPAESRTEGLVEIQRCGEKKIKL